MCGIRLAVLLACALSALAWPESSWCSIRAQTEGGWVCGVRRVGDDHLLYASFRGVPYAKQPLGELRFKELQPVEPWEGFLDATQEGPICPQHDVLYGRLMTSRNMSEACIHANIHVPLADLPGYVRGRLARSFLLPRQAASAATSGPRSAGLPIVVFIHGGGFAFGSGGADLNGPEYLVSKRVIVITFNYRLNVMGFLSLNSSSIPGNNGLRDMVTLLRWVQRNAHHFGGDPLNVTIAGQSAGASSAHLLSLSPAAKGLFQRVWLMSGVALPIFFATAPAYSQFAATTFLQAMKINATDPEVIHQQLIEAPIEKITAVNAYMLELFGLTTFMPTIESVHPGVTTILDEDPEALIRKGFGKDIPIVVGFTNVECETFRPRFEKIDIIAQIKANPLLIVSPQLLYTTPPAVLPGLANEIQDKYFNETLNMKNFVKLCTDHYFIYPALRLASLRAETGGAPVYLYEFSYNNKHSVLKEAFGISYTGAAHIEDLTYVFKANSIMGNESVHTPMKDKMTALFINFMRTSKPSPEDWPAVKKNDMKYHTIAGPHTTFSQALTETLMEVKSFFDSIFQNVAR